MMSKRRSLVFVSAIWLVLSAAGRGIVGETEINIPNAAAHADLILIGKAPVPQKAVLDRARKGPTRLIGYRIEPIKFLKGAAQHSKREGPGYVHIRADETQVKQGDSFQVPKKNTQHISYIYFLTVERAGYPYRPREKPLSPNKWFLVATPENIKEVQANLPEPKEWGKESKGLRLGILTTKFPYKIGECTDIELYIQNVADEAIRIPQHRLAIGDYYPFTHFRGGTNIRCLGEHSYSFGQGLHVTFEKPPGVDTKESLPPVILEPGQVYCESVRLNSWQWTTLDGLTPFRSGTNWKLMAVFDTRSISEDSQLWQGILASEYVDVKFE